MSGVCLCPSHTSLTDLPSKIHQQETLNEIYILSIMNAAGDGMYSGLVTLLLYPALRLICHSLYLALIKKH